nr:hypothetical protein [uncultured Acetatifactor sp.]
MGSRHNLDGLMREQEYVDAKIVDSPYGYKMVIPVFNEAVPAFYVGRVMETVEAFLDAYMVACGTSLGPESLYVDGNLSIRQSAIRELEKIPEDKIGFILQIMQGVNGLYNDNQSERKEAFARLEMLGY